MVKTTEFAELQKLCLRSFPERLDQRLSAVRRRAGGRHRELTLTLSWREGRRPRVEQLLLRRYGDPWTWWSLEDHAKAHREWQVMRWLYGEGMPVPALYACGSSIDSRRLSGSDDADGFVLMARGPGRSGAPRSRPVADALARLLAQVHHLGPPAAVRGTLPHVTVGDQLERLGQIACLCHDDGLAEAVNDLVAREMEVFPPCVLHGDPRIANTLHDTRGITALPAWENSAFGDPRWDVARAIGWLRADHAEAWIDPFCHAYLGESGRDLLGMPYWETLVAVQTWATAAWVRASADSKRPLPRAATEALHSQVETYEELAWRALTRLRHGVREQSTPDDQLASSDRR